MRIGAIFATSALLVMAKKSDLICTTLDKKTDSTFNSYRIISGKKAARGSKGIKGEAALTSQQLDQLEDELEELEKLKIKLANWIKTLRNILDNILSDPDQCESNPCVHGQCLDRFRAYKCVCNQGYRGTNCSVAENRCGSKPCPYPYDCVQADRAYICACPPGRSGETCSDGPEFFSSNPGYEYWKPYIFRQELLTWQVSRNVCNHFGGDLITGVVRDVTIRSDFLEWYLQISPSPVAWIGLKFFEEREDRNAGWFWRERRFRLLSNPGNTVWGENEPSNEVPKQKKCAFISARDQSIYSETCQALHPVICTRIA